MPTYERTDSFKSDYRALPADERAAFLDALHDFIEDLIAMENGTQNDFRAGLRVKPMKGWAGIWEMSWGGDRRATFEYGMPPVMDDDDDDPSGRHVVWRRIGTHAIFRSP